ncbi:MAG: NAD(P)H-binding protein [Acidobacteria bacterium]|nr:NAD(P)H-binding protein [Acidobacteriota bacterium]
MGELVAVTGAFSYTGSYIAQRLLAAGHQVRTLTGHPERADRLSGRVSVFPYNFEKPDELRRSLAGVATLYNTYWVRFPRGALTFETAVENNRALFRAAAEAGVRRVVHISVSNADESSPLPYFAGKGKVEAALRASGLSYAILRPTLVFGREDILLNNITWLLRRFPVFAVPGDGCYRLQPVYVDEVAALAVEAGGRTDNVVFDAVGPETFTYNELLRLIAEKIGCRMRLLHLPPTVVRSCAGVLGLLVRDVLLTREEIAGLMANLLVSQEPPTAETRLSHWLEENAASLGRRYASELSRHFR